MKNQKGEVVIGIMIVLMGVMILFGGMHSGHGWGGSGGHCMRDEQKHEPDQRMDQVEHVRDHAVLATRGTNPD